MAENEQTEKFFEKIAGRILAFIKLAQEGYGEDITKYEFDIKFCTNKQTRYHAEQVINFKDTYERPKNY